MSTSPKLTMSEDVAVTYFCLRKASLESFPSSDSTATCSSKSASCSSKPVLGTNPKRIDSVASCGNKSVRFTEAEVSSSHEPPRSEVNSYLDVLVSLVIDVVDRDGEQSECDTAVYLRLLGLFLTDIYDGSKRYEPEKALEQRKKAQDFFRRASIFCRFGTPSTSPGWRLTRKDIKCWHLIVVVLIAAKRIVDRYRSTHDRSVVEGSWHVAHHKHGNYRPEKHPQKSKEETQFQSGIENVMSSYFITTHFLSPDLESAALQIAVSSGMALTAPHLMQMLSASDKELFGTSKIVFEDEDPPTPTYPSCVSWDCPSCTCENTDGQVFCVACGTHWHDPDIWLCDCGTHCRFSNLEDGGDSSKDGVSKDGVGIVKYDDETRNPLDRPTNPFPAESVYYSCTGEVRLGRQNERRNHFRKEQSTTTNRSDLLSFSKLKIDCDVHEFVLAIGQSLVEDFSSMESKKTESESMPMSCKADKNRFEDALTNLERAVADVLSIDDSIVSVDRRDEIKVGNIDSGNHDSVPLKLPLFPTGQPECPVCGWLRPVVKTLP